MAVIENLVVGKEYSIKLTYKGRKAKFTFEKYTQVNTSETEIVEVMNFRNNTGNIFVTTEHIESIEETTTTKKKAKAPKTCPRCLGNKVYENYSHINAGKCFKCNGTGLV